MQYLTSAEGDTLTIYDGYDGTVVLALDGVENTFSAEELVRLIIGESISAATEVGEIAKRAIRQALDNQVGNPN